MQSKSHPKYGCKEIIPSRELGTEGGFMAWLVQCSQDSLLFIYLFLKISDIKLEALRNQVASSGVHIPLFRCLMLDLQQAVVGGPSVFSLTLIGSCSCLVSAEWY